MAPTDRLLAWLHGEIRTPPFTPEARVEAGEADVSLDLLVRAMLNPGATARDVAHAIAAA